MILAAKAIPGSLSVPELWTDLKTILHGLFALKIQIVSYACDGTETERGVQRELLAASKVDFSYRIPDPDDINGDPILIRIAEFEGHPIVLIQDSKHALKTFRNNLNSGARLLVFGNFLATYALARKLAFDRGGPCFERDFVNLDRQDDNAASRVFSSGSLRFLIEQHSNWLGLIVYLFVFGELVDAYQNRRISIRERVRMALRAHFFIRYWVAYLRKTDHDVARHCLSREALDICNYLVSGLIGLVVVFRDHLGGKVFPLLFWKFATDANEHVFGIIRRILQDFGFLDFIFMVPQIMILLRAAKWTAPSDPKARAAGYAHTYAQFTGVDLDEMSLLPSDREIAEDAQIARAEAVNLWSILGVNVEDLGSCRSAHTTSSPPDDAADDEDGDESDDDAPDEDLMEQVIRYQEQIRGMHDERLTQITTAAVSVLVDAQLAL
jgi:hypothetical protein